MRMRKLGKGQTVVFCVPKEIAAKISRCAPKSTSAGIAKSDILHWAITETWTDMHRSMPLWASQGVRFVHQDALWKEAQDATSKTVLPQQQAKAFLEPEAQSLEDRYSPSIYQGASLFTGEPSTRTLIESSSDARSSRI